jgi:tripartite-type tricarboxylate transporter receptor subunit TctC
MRAITRLFSTAWIGLAASLASTVPAQAAYPNKPTRIIVPYSAGGSVDLLALVKAPSGRLSYGPCGVGTPAHPAGELHEFLTRSFVVHASCRGCSPATRDTIGGPLDAVFATIATVSPHARAGKFADNKGA